MLECLFTGRPAGRPAVQPSNLSACVPSDRGRWLSNQANTRARQRTVAGKRQQSGYASRRVALNLVCMRPDCGFTLIGSSRSDATGSLFISPSVIKAHVFQSPLHTFHRRLRQPARRHSFLSEPFERISCRPFGLDDPRHPSSCR